MVIQILRGHSNLGSFRGVIQVCGGYSDFGGQSDLGDQSYLGGHSEEVIQI